MNIFVFVTAYGLADDLLQCVNVADSDQVTFLLYLHSTRPDVVAMCDQLAERPNVVYYPYGENRGMSTSINEAILYAQEQRADVLVSLNDDIICPSNRVIELAQYAIDNPDVAYVQAQGYTVRVGRHEPLGFSCCAWNMQTFDKVGLFDENFHPFYFMDADWKRRAELLNLYPLTLDMPDVTHGGSKTLTHVDGAAEWLATAFDNTRSYYLSKWGGDQRQECFGNPFNDPTLSLVITKRERADPYPTYRPAFRGKGT